VSYRERDVSRDPTAVDELSKLGVMTTPVITVDGEIVVGFDVEKLEALLG
jgi:glutaredoxin 3